MKTRRTRARGLWTAGILLAAIALFAGGSAAQGFDSSAWGRVLRQYVGEGGRVDYAALKSNPGDLDRFVGEIAARSPLSDPQDFSTRDAQLAYWINAYNALVMYGVIENWPVKSVREIGWMPFSFFWHKKFRVGGREMTLNDIEGLLRQRLAEPRAHFALNCASNSCPPLRREPYRPGKVERQLDEAARAFLDSPSGMKIDAAPDRVTLSRIFKWYRSDFEAYASAKHLPGAGPPLLDFVRCYSSEENRRVLDALHNPQIDFFVYDWGIDAAHSPFSGPRERR